MQNRRFLKGGFALPTVLIASVVMMIILTVSVSSVAAIRTALKVQYYEQLAQVAGEAGVAYAKACLAKNGNVAQWTNALPLKPNTDCSGNALAGVTCPGDARCAVMTNGTIRSSFSVNAPTVDGQGKALTIPNSGFVELLRASNGQVWRTYKQPSVQSAVVPDLCSGAASSSLGWSTAVAASAGNQRTIASAPSATTIGISSSAVSAGQAYFRRDFMVPADGTYQVSALTNNATDKVEMYVDDKYVTASTGALATGNIVLTSGCHTVSARLTNRTVLPGNSQFTASLKLNSSTATAPVVVTDSDWRVSAGATVSFADTAFYADPSVWLPVKMNNTPTTPTPMPINSNWSVGGDVFTPIISPGTSGCPSLCPGASSSYLRDSKDFYLASETVVTGSLMCDNACELFIDGERVMTNNTSLNNGGAGWASIVRQSFTLGPGHHRAGIILYNEGSAANPAAVAMSLVQSGGAVVIARTDMTWEATDWFAGNQTNVYSYEKTFRPSPKDFADPVTADVVVVAGGGGGGRNAAGGGGAGGVLYIEGHLLSSAAAPSTPSTTLYTVVVGAGGAGSTSLTTTGSNGSNSVFGGYTATGGGAGASRDGGTAPTWGGSGGGGAGTTTAGREIGAAGVTGQGNRGGNGVPADAGVNTTAGGGGGAGGSGSYGVSGGSAGNGGAGLLFYLDTNRRAVANGGGGGLTVNGTIGTGPDGGGNGSLNGVGGSGAANTGSGGGGGGGGTGGAGGAGGSGVVLVRIKTGSASITTTGTVSTTTTTIDGVQYTIYRFTTNGTFRVNSLSPS